MLQKITVYIDQENIDVLSDILQRFRGLLEGDWSGRCRSRASSSSCSPGRSTLLADQQNYLQSLDAFKLEIGVPMHLSIEMDDTESAAADPAVSPSAGDHRAMSMAAVRDGLAR